MTNSPAARVGLISVKAASKLVMNQTSLFKWETQRDRERLHLKVPPHQFFCEFFSATRELTRAAARRDELSEAHGSRKQQEFSYVVAKNVKIAKEFKFSSP